MEPTPYHPRLNIHPGDWYIGNKYHSIYTVLGSCVSLTAWHPVLKLGGMCHFILPELPKGMTDREEIKAGRYANTALLLLKNAILKHDSLARFQFGLFGGSDTISHFDIGKKNIRVAQQWLDQENLIARQIDVGGTISRSLILTMSTGTVAVKRYEMQTINVLPTVTHQKGPKQ
ncbi:MAG: chemotaxis protein CheD [Pseudomonadota bacterium]